MSMSLRSLLAPSLALALSFAGPALSQDAANLEPKPENIRLWQAFAHNTLVANPEIAKGFADQIVQLDDMALLAAIEASGDNYEVQDLQPWTKNDTLREVWAQIEDKYQAALTNRARSEAQIRSDIEALGRSSRERFNATKRLKQTGQFAAPYYIEYLEDDSRKALHPLIIATIREVGKELTYPLSVALPNVSPATQSNLAVVLGEIGYPDALPYLKMVIESDADGNIKAVCQNAFDKILPNADVPSGASAAGLFVDLGQKKYVSGTRGDDMVNMDLYNQQGVIWRYNNSAGLVLTAIPRQVFGDVLAMQAGRNALELDPNDASALTLHLTANLRRENNLDGAQDPSYTLPNPPAFYVLLAGADQQKAVLARALQDEDAALALDGIEAMAKTSGDAVLLGSGDARQPVLDGLYYSDRRVRFTSAITLAQAKPGETFTGSFSVVPVLGQAVRQSEQLNALVVAGEPDLVNSAMESIEFGSVAANSLDVASTKAAAAFPGVDLIVYSGDLTGFEALIAGAKADGQLSVVPILALVEPSVATAIGLKYPKVVTASPLAFDATAELPDSEADRLEQLANAAVLAYGGEPITSDEALAYAERALALLEEIAGNQSIYEARDVLSILIEALGDDRPTVATGAGQVLALIDEQVAQAAIAEEALSRPGSVQIALLGSLAESAKNFGNQLDAGTVDRLATLVTTSSGSTALAAARAHGALTELSTERATGILFK